MKYYLTIMFLFSILMVTLQAQSPLVVKEDKSYLFDGDKYSFKELMPIISKDDLSLKYAKKSFRGNRVANITGYISVGSIISSIVLLNLKDNRNESVTEEKLLGVGFGIFAWITGTTALIAKGKSKKNREKSIDYLNQYLSKRTGIGYEKPQLYLKGSGNSVGFEIRF